MQSPKSKYASPNNSQLPNPKVKILFEISEKAGEAPAGRASKFLECGCCYILLATIFVTENRVI
jgi:hypothetical protein